MAIRKPGSINEDTASITETVRPPLVKTRTEQSVSPSITSTIVPDPGVPIHDIEHMPVKNDPRAWSRLKKNFTLILISTASMVAALAANIQNPAVEAMEEDLPATASQFSLSISLFILIQGLFPLVWSAISEVKGRKLVYILSIALFTLGSIIVALSTHIGPVIGFRCLQAAGSSAVMAIGAASLADIFEPAERGSKMGIYYIAPLLGPAVGPVFGGILTSIWGWRAIFWFLAIIAGATLISFITFFQDTFRCERSLIYQKVLKAHIRANSLLPPAETLKKDTSDPVRITGKDRVDSIKSDVDIEKVAEKITAVEVLREPLFQVVRRPNNLLILLSSGLLYAYGFVVVYATSRTLSANYGLDPLKIGLVTIAYGAGSVGGSIIGGRWSDRQLAKLKAANGGKGYAEMRLASTFIGMVFLPPSVAAFGWVTQNHLPIPVICVCLFLGGFFCIWIYSSSLAYVVDANIGRSSTAVAGNSAFRGIFAFMATEVAVPLQDNLGDGWMFVLWSAVVSLGCACILLVRFKGEKWRVDAELREAEHARRADTATFSTMTSKA
ncbi:MFS general substrate transporter [Pholiota conissans]|uniref:MFS general substrate transporter n=1 Tax=Pholiota conissans TaxID=109636 RepID=A0A9P5YVE5_9AGAR|nr:MFS general substrate transporter [Pholiota conissans]